MWPMPVQSKALRFKFLQPQPLPVEILVDMLRLHQILLNLLTNAVKYTLTGYVRLLVTAIKTHDNQAFLTFAVSDRCVYANHDEV
jgi:signal transduction histidine kinase